METEIVVDTDLQAVLSFIQANVQPSRLVSIAAHVNTLAPLMWGKFRQDPVWGIRLRPKNAPADPPLAPNPDPAPAT